MPRRHRLGNPATEQSGGFPLVQPQATVLDDEVDDFGQSLAARNVGETKRPFSPHSARVAFHVEVDVHIGRQVALVDDWEIPPA